MELKHSVGFAIVWDGKILLSHPTGAPWYKSYSVIKGTVEPNEIDIDAAIREFQEETGQLTYPDFYFLSAGREPDIIVQNKEKTLAVWVVILPKLKMIGLEETTMANGKKHIVYPKEQLQHNEIDWAGFVDFEEAKSRMAPYQLPVLQKAIEISEYRKRNPLQPLPRPGIQRDEPKQLQEEPPKQTVINMEENTHQSEVHNDVNAGSTVPATSTDMTKLISDGGKHVPYIPISDICSGSLGTVVPKGMASEMINALIIVRKKLQEKYGWDLDDYVQDRLQYSPEELGIERNVYDKASPDGKRKLINGKLCDVFAGEQVDALALAIFNIEASANGNGYGMIIGDMTGIGKGRIAAGLIRYCIKFLKKTPIFFTEKGYLFSDIFRDLADIKTDPMIPLYFQDGEYQKQVKMSNTEIQKAIKERIDLGDSLEEATEAVEAMAEKGTKTIYKYRLNPNYAKETKSKNNRITRVVPFILNARAEETKIKDLNGNIVYEPLVADEKFRQILANKHLPKDYNLIMLTYSQISRAGTSVKMSFVKAMADETIIICDESHVASGMSNTGAFIFKILSSAAGAAFLSATYSKRPDNMVVYAAKTAIREAQLSQDDLIAAIKRGGVPLQEIISSQLVGEGQMVRRERTYDGVNVLWNTLDRSMTIAGHPEFDLKDKHSAIANMFTEILRDIIELQEKHIKPALRDTKVIMKALELAMGERPVIDRHQDITKLLTSSPMFSRVFNTVNQLLFSIKAEAIAERAINYMKEGKKPIIAFSSTMGAFLEGLTNDQGEPLESGDIVDTDFKLVLNKLLKTLLVITVKDPTGDVSRKLNIDKSLLPYEARAFYQLIEQKIKKISIGITISPIDVLLYKIKEAGFKVGEVTGRSAVINFTDSTFMRGSYESRSKPSTSDTFRAFNENRLDCVLINQSGSTGASIQAAPNKVVNKVSYKRADGTIATEVYKKELKNEVFIVPSSLEPRDEIKQRVMVMLQSELNINTEVQKRGRIFRSGQLLMPMYDYICTAVPAEMRLQMMMQKKLRSLDANTSSNQKSSDTIVNVVDFLNPYGDDVVIKYLIENPTLITRLGDPFGMINKEGKIVPPVGGTPQDAAHRLTGRVAILSVSDQEKFYTEVSQKYIDTIKLLEDTQQYNGEVQHLDLQAITIERNIYQVGSGGASFFGKNSILERCEVNNLRKPYTQKELDVMLSEGVSEEFSSFSNAAQRQAAALVKKHKSFHEDRLRNMDKRYAENLADSLERLKEDTQYKKLYAKSPEEAETWMKNVESEVKNKNKTDKADEIEKITQQYSVVHNLLEKLYVGQVTNYVSGKIRVRAVIVSVDVDEFRYNPFAPSAIYVRVAVANGIRYISVPLSNTEVINSLIVETTVGPTEIYNTLHKWDDITRESMSDRVERYLLTGNILQAMGDAVVAENGGQLIKFTHVRNKRVFVRNGILMPSDFNPSKHTGGRGSTFVLVPAKKCGPVLDRLEYKGVNGDNQVYYETNNQIQISRTKNGDDFLIRVPNDRQSKYIFNDPKMLEFLKEDKGFTNWGRIFVFNTATSEKEEVPALGGTVSMHRLQALLEFISEEYRGSFKISRAVFEEVKDLLGIDMQDDYGDGLDIEESESGLAQTNLRTLQSINLEAEEATQDPVAEAGEIMKMIKTEAERGDKPLQTEVLHQNLNAQAQILREKEIFEYEKQLFKLQRLLLTGKLQTGGQA